MTQSSPIMAARHLVDAYWTADRSAELVEHTVGGLLTARATEHPGRLALLGVHHGSGAPARLTYAQLLDQASRVATALSRLARPGSFVALWAPNIIEWSIIQYGASLAGMVLVALNPTLTPDELDYALRHSGARVLLHADTSRDYELSPIAEQVCANIAELQRVSLSEITVWCADAVDPNVIAQAPTDPDVPVMLQYTSGTTGRPKGVLLTHRAMVNVAKLTMEAVDTPAGALCVNPLPLFHTAGCVIATLGPLWVAGAVVMCERFLAGPALSILRKPDAAVLFYVPTVLRALLDEQRRSSEPAPVLPIIMGGASNVSAELIDDASAVFGASVFNLFGQTELSPVLSLTRPSDERSDRLATVGRPLPRVDCKIRDPESGKVLPVGQIGEICARGYQQFVGYLHDKGATRRALDAEGFVRTGDLGFMDERGYLSVTGRLKELIIRGGENIAPMEIEEAVAQHEQVQEVVAVGLPDERFGEIVSVVCRVRTGHSSGLKDQLIAHTRNRVAASKVPARWFVVDRYPVTATGKVRRFALRDAILQDQLHEL